MRTSHSAVRVLGLSSFLAIAASALSARDAAAQGVFRGPYLNHVTGDAVTVVWESPAPTTGVVRYGSAVLDQRAESNTPARHHEVRLTNLAAIAPAGSEFRYELEVDAVVHVGTFRTMPSTGPFHFVVYGDNRSSPQQHQLVVDALLAEQPRPYFAINTGDMVSNGQSETDWDAFFPVAQPFLAKMPLYVAIGNHEVSGGSFSLTERIFEMPTDVAPASNNEGFYRVIYNNVELIVINVEVDNLYTIELLQGDQEEWLTQVLADRAAGVEHRFLFLHQGPYSSKVGRNGNYWLRRWLDQLDAADIDVIFTGHDHYLERGWAQTGIWYVVHGGGGAPLYNTQGPRVTTDHTIMHSESRLGYLIVEIDGPRAHVVAKGLAGEVVDEFRYGDTVNPICTTAADCGPAPVHGCPAGAWDCHRSACQYVCPEDSGSSIMCATDRACEDQIGMTCAGTPSCEHPSINPTTWFCMCNLPPECSTAADCSSRPPPVAGCMGTWGCVDQQCEFTTTVCMPVDAGVPDASGDDDAAVNDGAATGGEDAAAPAADASSSGTDGGGGPLPGRDAGGAADAAGGLGAAAPGACGCRDVSREHGSVLALISILLLLAAVRAPRGGPRTKL